MMAIPGAADALAVGSSDGVGGPLRDGCAGHRVRGLPGKARGLLALFAFAITGSVGSEAALSDIRQAAAPPTDCAEAVTAERERPKAAAITAIETV